MLKRESRYVTLSLFVFVLTGVSATYSQQDQAEWVGPWRYRLPVTIDPDSRMLANSPVGVKINFQELLSEHAIDGRVDHGTIQVVRYAPNPNREQAGQQDAHNDLIPHQLTGDFANNDAGMVWWRVDNSSDRCFHLYFDTDDHGRKLASRLPGLIGIGDVFHYNDKQSGFAGNFGLHSTYWHLDWDGDGLRDLIGFGLRTYEHGAELEVELGNAIYFYKNIGSSGHPLFAPPYRVKSEDGTYLRSDYLYQNIFPTDWDNDGDTDFFGFRANTIYLYENTDKRDRNGLYLIKQPRPIAKLQVSEYREHDPNPLGKRYWSLRGARYVDWEGDGDRDLIVTLRTVNKVGEEDPSRGIIPYGNGLQIFEVYENISAHANDSPVFAKPYVLREERGILITAFGPAPGGPEYVDWDSDGDLDLLFHDLTNRPLMGGSLMFAENIGTREKPLFVMPIPILETTSSPIVIDWNDDGRFDLIAGGEFFENVNPLSGQNVAGSVSKPLGTYYPRPRHYPKFVSRGLAQQVDPLLYTYFTVCVDWDGDGVLDLVSGFQSGINFYRNSGSVLKPVFDRGVALKADGKRIDLPNWFDPQADEPAHWGPQGPGEPRHGWSVPSVTDWDGDGDLDLFVTSQRWQVQYFENVGTRTEPRLARGREVRCGGNPHEFSWRSKVSLGDIDGDGHMELVVTSHQDNVFYAYEVKGEQEDGTVLELERGDSLTLEDNQPVQGWYGGQNNNGDNHSQLIDWDHDGDLDLLNGSLGAVWYYENVGSPTATVFKAHGKFKAGGQVIHTFNHAGSFDAADWNGDGRLDLILGAECPSDQPLGARLHLFDRSYLDDELPSVKHGELEQR